MAELRLAFRLPVANLPRALFVSDYGLHGGRLLVDGAVVLEAPSHASLVAGVAALLPDSRHRVSVRASDGCDVRLFVDDTEVPREERLRAPTSRSAWLHALLALAGSGLGFVASWLYLRRAETSHDPWAMKMALHMAAWHLLLTLTLLPASVWGQRPGIRAVQGAGLVFFCIHLGIALANLGHDASAAEGPWIGLLNAASGLAFFATVLQGQRAHADMDPLRALASTVESPPAP